MDFIIRNIFALLGAIAFISLLHDIITIEEHFKLVLQAARDYTRPFWEWALGWLPFSVPDLVKDYLTMGAITAGMRTRSSFLIWKALRKDLWPEAVQKIPFSNRAIILKKGEVSKFYLKFLPLRIVIAFFAWPVRIATATWHYLTGHWKKDFDNNEWHSEEAMQMRKQQYIIFFETFRWVLVLLAINEAWLRWLSGE